MSVKILEQSDIAPLSAVLADAFSADPGLRYVFPDNNEWQRIAPSFFRHTLQTTIRRGHAITDADRHGVSLWEPPGHENSFAVQLYEFAWLSLLFRRNLGRAIRMQAYTHKFRPSRPFWYLTYIATSPPYQRQGIGSELLNPMLDLAEREQCAVFLECSNRENLSFYVAHGFNIVDEIRLPDGPSIWPMLREPR